MSLPSNSNKTDILAKRPQKKIVAEVSPALWTHARLTLTSLMTRIRITTLVGSFIKRVASLLLFVSLFTFAAFSDDDQGHHHPEDLTGSQLGTVHFPVSCAASEQKPFTRGVALLHSFWYEEAEKEFLHIAKDDPPRSSTMGSTK